jgi:hypothetical protein
MRWHFLAGIFAVPFFLRGNSAAFLALPCRVSSGYSLLQTDPFSACRINSLVIWPHGTCVIDAS